MKADGAQPVTDGGPKLPRIADVAEGQYKIAPGSAPKEAGSPATPISRLHVHKRNCHFRSGPVKAMFSFNPSPRQAGT